ncbi:MAG: HDOD domain-containing protein [Desulfocapsa sp.]|jgi:EAL and modified HD-GYP domain-containing signal transduction protein|nr:HDOD domain-containing protein [Desulfocapsa sp.]
MDVFVARQPIFNRHRRIFAYELLFRDGNSNAFPGIDGDEATSSLLSSSFFTVGIEQIASGHRAFINFTEEMLLRGVPSMFPARSIVVEILEDVAPSEEVIAACSTLVSKGYMLALDDFIYSRDRIPLLELVKIIKVDFMQSSNEQILESIAISKEYNCKLLAEKIETYEEYDRASRMGFVYFQGYFFAKPEVLKNKEISSSQMFYMQLLVEVNRAEFEIKKLESLIKQDVAISYKLIKYLNSAYYSRLQPLSSIRQAIAFLGEQGIKMFVSLIATSKLAENKPDELIRTSCIRARFLELLGKELQQDQGLFFMLGLFSLLDAILDAPMESLMRQLPVSEGIMEALVYKTGPLFPYLQLIQLYESGQWSELDQIMTHLDLENTNIMDFYLDAVCWSGYLL